MMYRVHSPISKPFRETEAMTEWARRNCASYHGYTLDKHHDPKQWHYCLFFEAERDAVWFRLRWS